MNCSVNENEIKGLGFIKIILKNGEGRVGVGLRNSKMGENPSGEREREKGARLRRNGFGERKGEYL